MINGKRFLVYKSSAGSGKTFTLARVYLALVLGNKATDYFKKILAITFTVRAAAEMKERIISYLSAMSGASGRNDTESMIGLLRSDTGLNDEEIRQRSGQILNAILHSYSEFSILTIDKFAHRLIRSFSSDLGLTPDFEVEIDQGRINDLVVESLFEKAGKGDDLTRLLLQFIEHQLQEDKSWDIQNHILETANELNSEEFFLKSPAFKGLMAKDVTRLKSWIEHELEAFYEKVSRPAREALENIKSSGLTAEDFFHGTSGIYGYFLAAATRNHKKLEPNSWVLKTIGEGKWQSGTKNPVVLTRSEGLEQKFHEIQNALQNLPRIRFLQGLMGTIFTMGLVEELRTLFLEVKTTENIQTLQDFYRMISQKFSAEQTPFIYERLGNRYAHILIDEFQDTSLLQWQNIVPLVENSLSEGQVSLVVGDVKQSIYRFRGSEPSQFLQLPNVGRQSDLLFAEEYNEQVLIHNYRSAKSIVQFNNRFFESLVGNVLEHSLSGIYNDLKQTAVSPETGSVTFRFVSEIPDTDKRELFLDCFDQRINELLDQNIRLGDICILFHRNSDASYMAAGLLEKGYHVVSEESLLLEHNPEVQLLISTLCAHRFADDPFYQQRWLSRLKLMEFVTESEYHSKAQELKQHKLDFKELSRALNLELDLRQMEHGDSFSMLYYLSGFFKLNREGPFISKLLDFALDFEHSGTFLKYSFLAHWETKQSKLSIELQDGQNAIRIMTIHKSKGLEFPAVLIYLPELQFDRLTKDYAWMTSGLDIPELDSALMKVQQLKNTPFQEIYDEELAKSTLDKINILYVAMTRARSHMDIFSLEKGGQPKSKELQFITQWPEWNAEKLMLQFT